MDLDRRQLLRLSAAGAFGALSGCVGGDDDSSGTEGLTATETNPSTNTPTQTETATETETTKTETAETETVTQTDTEMMGETVTVLNNYFSSIRVSIAPGEEIVWSNQASGAYTSHSVTSTRFHDSAEEWDFDTDISGGEEVAHTFQESGIYEYYCTLHGETSMCGVVVVGDVTLEETLPCE